MNIYILEQLWSRNHSYLIVVIRLYKQYFLGPLLQEILERLHAFNDGQDTRRTYLYSAHDITLVNLLRTMGFTNEYFKPDYGSTLIFELHVASNSADTELKVLYISYWKESFLIQLIFVSSNLFSYFLPSSFLYFLFILL